MSHETLLDCHFITINRAVIFDVKVGVVIIHHWHCIECLGLTGLIYCALSYVLQLSDLLLSSSCHIVNSLMPTPMVFCSHRSHIVMQFLRSEIVSSHLCVIVESFVASKFITCQFTNFTACF